MMNNHQVKSRYYYVFWGLATVTVALGQLYVGLGYRVMAESVNTLTHALVQEIPHPEPQYRPMQVTKNSDFQYE